MLIFSRMHIDLKFARIFAFVVLLLLPTLTRSQSLTISNVKHKDDNGDSPASREMGTLEFKPDQEPRFEMLQENQVHLYRGSFEANYYLQIRVDFRSVDGLLRLYAPSGARLQEVASPDSIEARKELWLLTEEPGEYRLEIEAKKRGSSGTYSVIVHSLISNDLKNQRLIDATRLQAEGWRLHEIGTRDALREAIPKLQTAISLWWELGEKWNYQECTMYLGEVYHYLSDYRKAIQVYETILPFIVDPTKGDPTWTYNNLASSHNAIGEKQKAREYYERSLIATEEIDRFLRETRGHPILPGAFGIALMGLGNFSIQLGEKQQALDYLYRALPYLKDNRQDNPETVRLARAYRGLSQVHASLGDRERATAYATQALQYSRNTADFVGQVEALNTLGSVHSADANYPEAIRSFEDALRISRGSGDRSGQAKALANLGHLYLNSAAIKDAENSFTEALALFREIESRADEARALTGLGMVGRLQGNLKRAIELYQQALPLREFTLDLEGEAETRYETARAHLDLGDPTTARSEIEKAIERIEIVRRGFLDPNIRAAYRSTAQRYYEFHVKVLMLLHDRTPRDGFDVLAFERSELSRARSLQESLREAGLNIREGVSQKLLRRERELEQLLSDKSDYRTRLLSGQFTGEQKAEADQEIDALLEECQRVQSEIRAGSPRYAALTHPARVTLKDIQAQALDADTVLLEYDLGEESSFLWLVTTDSISSFQLPKRSEVEKIARRLYMSLSSPTITYEFRSHARKLSQILLSSVAERIRGKRLLIVGNGILQYIPFSTLPDPVGSSPKNRPLIVDHEIVTLPSASTLVLLRTEGLPRQMPSKTLAVFADPVFSTNDSRVARRTEGLPQLARTEATRSLSEIHFEMSRGELMAGTKKVIPRLPSTRLEALAISRSIPIDKRMVALGFDASLGTALSGELGQYRIVHFATHGLLDSKRPELSGLVLSLVDRDGTPTNGFLQAHEIYNLKLPVELVVLSACRTALGKDVKGEGLLGVTRGFMYAGAPRVVSSLWEVDSKATAELMRRFYRAMLNHKLAPPAALRAAQVSMVRDRRWHSPNYWAGFIIQGEYR